MSNVGNINAAVSNGAKFRDTVHNHLRRWLRGANQVRSEERAIYQKITGEMCRCDLFIAEGAMQWPFDGQIAIECKTQKTSGSAHERIWCDYVNALLRSPMCTLFVTESSSYVEFCNFVTSREAALVSKVLGAQHIWAVNGLQELVDWYECHRKPLL